MRHRDAITIRGDLRDVWAAVGSPERWPLFHVKAGEVRHVGGTAGRVGAIYEIEFGMGSRRQITRCEIVELDLGRRIVVRSAVEGRSDTATMAYNVEDQVREVRVTERVEFESTAIPWFLRSLIWLLLRFGHPTGETTLQRLKRLIEDEADRQG